STSTPVLPSPLTRPATRPSAAARSDFLAAFDSPLVRSQSMAASRSAPVSCSAFLQSIMPAPDFSRRSLTSAAVTSAIGRLLQFISDVRGPLQDPPRQGRGREGEPLSPLALRSGSRSRRRLPPPRWSPARPPAPRPQPPARPPHLRARAWQLLAPPARPVQPA